MSRTTPVTSLLIKVDDPSGPALVVSFEDMRVFSHEPKMKTSRTDIREVFNYYETGEWSTFQQLAFGISHHPQDDAEQEKKGTDLFSVKNRSVPFSEK